ncbi:hypothetical protein ARMSODRAFT_56872 [Armillaria solidipes]|uniref:Ankyrin n=1 Tax=Armillaria solidipes TaxID=1076256 RepID=A0A2H3CAA9_9AGAR|nr:hypothetical protein ARMSODRAFT_56872 [Armillaria solidipes]
MNYRSGSKLEQLPVELLYEIQLFALSGSLPYSSRLLYDTFNASPNSFRAQYILGRVLRLSPSWPPELYSRVIRFRLCSSQVLDIICDRCADATCLSQTTEIPRHLFQHLLRLKKPSSQWSEADHPLPYVRHLHEKVPNLNLNAHGGYALAMAVHGGFVQLIQCLLTLGADPRRKNGLSVLIAVRNKSLPLVRLLVEPGYGQNVNGPKKRKVTDRIQCERYPELLKAAVKCDARDIVDYLRQKGCVPDMETLGLMHSSH